jgi:hypothetical protein
VRPGEACALSCAGVYAQIKAEREDGVLGIDNFS